MKNRGLKVLALAILLIIPLIWLSTKTLYSGMNPPPKGTHLMGPAVIANLTFEPTVVMEDEEYECVMFYGEGKCMGQDVDIEDNYGLCPDITFEELDEKTLKNAVFTPAMSIIPLDSPCFPDVEEPNAVGIVIQAVLKYEFTRFPRVKKAKVILLFVVPKGK